MLPRLAQQQADECSANQALRDMLPFPRHTVHPSSIFFQNKVASPVLPMGKKPPQGCAVGGYQLDPGKTMQGLDPLFNLLGSDADHAQFILPA